MAKEQNGTYKIYVYVAILVGLTTLLNRGIDLVTANATEKHEVIDIKKDLEDQKADGCDPSRTNAYNMVRIETQLAGLKELVLSGKADNEADHRDLMDAINGASP